MVNYQFMLNKGHIFYELTEEAILNTEKRMGTAFPDELRAFYLDIGYGLIKGQSINAINRLLSPAALADINLREGHYEFDPDLDDIYEDKDQLIFFEVNEGVYLTISLSSENGGIFYFGTQIAPSLEAFLRQFLADNEYYIDYV
ncbi:SMI1/KNR4 family protein [Paenibacillus sp. CAU 1782]